MNSENIKDLLIAFSPASDFFAIASGDGRIKIWDTLKGQLQTEFSRIAPSEASSLLSQQDQRGHLSLDYTCMKWIQVESPKKRKKRRECSVLVVGTGNGDVLALNVADGQLRWKVMDCHPGGVSAVSSSGSGLVYTAGVDGHVCQIDALTGTVNRKFEASTKAVLSLSISADGMILATATSRLKVYRCSNFEKIRKFSGHTVAVRCMIFSEDGSYILSSGVGERYIAIWRINGGKKQHASCILSMDHPAVSLDIKGSDMEDADSSGLHVLAISEVGVCYIWHGSTIEELRTSKPTKISLSTASSSSRNNNNFAILGAKFQDRMTVNSALVLVAYGSLVKPSFDKLKVLGEDIVLEAAHDGVLMPIGQIPKKGQAAQAKVTALDRSNAEDADLPIPKVFIQGKKRKHAKADQLDSSVSTTKTRAEVVDKKVDFQKLEEDGVIILEDKLRAAGILADKDYKSSESCVNGSSMPSPDSTMYDGVFSLVYANTPAKKIRAHIFSMNLSDAYKCLEALVSEWKTRPTSSNNVVPWIYGILVNHGHHIVNHESSSELLDDLKKMTMSKGAAIQPLLKLCGSVQLVRTQIDKAEQNISQLPFDERPNDEIDDVDSEEDIDELVYGEDDDGSQSGSDVDNVHQ